MTFSPSLEAICSTLPRLYVVAELFSALLENAASEQSARVAAMNSAARNASDMANRLTVAYNSQRQVEITRELVEAISDDAGDSYQGISA